MKYVIFMMPMMLLAGFCFGQTTLYVVPLQNQNDAVANDDVETLNRVIENALQRTKRFVMVDRDAMKDLMKVHLSESDDWLNEKKSVEMGEDMGLDFIFRGQVSKFGANGMVVIGRILNAKNLAMLGSNDMQLSIIDEAYDKIEGFISKLTNQVDTELSRQREQETERRREAERQQELERKQAAQEQEDRERELERLRQREAARQRESYERSEWIEKRWYLGGGVGGGTFGSYTRYNEETELYDYYTRGGFAALLKAELDIAKHFAVDFDIGLGIGAGGELGDGASFYGGILAHVPFRFDSGFDIGILCGIHTGGEEFLNAAIGVSAGVRVGTAGEIFAEALVMQSFDVFNRPGFTGIIGYKIGLGSRD
jgi:hypothetical protein